MTQKTKLAVLHFSPLEYYPPVMNFLNVAGQYNNIKTKVYTTKTNLKHVFNNPEINIKRWSLNNNNALEKYYTNLLKRYYAYITYNIGTFIALLIYRPTSIILYETNSILPAYWFAKFSKKTKIFIHYHEYTSPEESGKASNYLKLIQRKEIKLLKKVIWISHTNQDRMDLFAKDFPFIQNIQKHILPNYPPSSWQENGITRKERKHGEEVKFVYVGAVGLVSMYLREIVSYIKTNLNYSLDIYTNTIDEDARQFILKCGEKIALKDGVSYYDLPNVYKNYDIGIIIYNGNIPNYIYNAPNKLFEYIINGLEVWYPYQMIGCNPYATNEYPKVIPVDFTAIDASIDKWKNNISQSNTYDKTQFTSEIVYKQLLEHINKALQ